ncbi:Endothelial cell-selective adhesion molecule [Bagarius yarrelli]|uniref:Endothelial cell-selective adhesion molecule n=1 Tax=Bagarius yarrelli TaxID=175774 RepID=A0A556TJZ8_BAGYA|nr:Endothelial cell-selective adhesion molecule [Bagarius yarrelli]
MESRTWEKLDTLLSVLTLLCLCPGLLSQLQLPQKDVVVIQGQVAVLQASYSGADLSEATIIWTYLADQSQTIISYINKPVVGDQYKDRVGFVYPMPNNNLSIYINNTVESDSGRYMCQVVLPETPEAPKELTLNVLVPPATPICKLQGNPEVKANVTLTCYSSSGKPVPKYKWSKTSPVSEIFFSPMLNEAAGTLKLNNLSNNMSGKYECTASNSAGEAKCYINLEVLTSSNAGVIAGATVGALVGLILIMLIVVFFWTRRKKEAEEDLANDIKEDAQAPKRVSWAKSGAESDIISKNGTLSSVRSSPLPQDTHNNHRHHHHHHHHYPVTQPTSDTASIITSSTSYRPRPAGLSSTLEHSLPGYNNNTNTATVPRNPPAPPSSNGGSLPRTEALQPSTPRYIPAPSGVSAANLSRMGGVPIMVPAQNQAGSLV